MKVFVTWAEFAKLAMMTTRPNGHGGANWHRCPDADLVPILGRAAVDLIREHAPKDVELVPSADPPPRRVEL